MAGGDGFFAIQHLRREGVTLFFETQEEGQVTSWRVEVGVPDLTGLNGALGFGNGGGWLFAGAGEEREEQEREETFHGDSVSG